MNILILLSMAFVLLGLTGLIDRGGRPLRRKARGRSPVDPSRWPGVGVIVPATGKASILSSSIHSLLVQNYPSYEIVFVTRTLEDPASEIIRRAIGEFKHAKHVISGKAEGCGQKNHNLLVGLKALGGDAEVLVFCDSTRKATPQWLRALVRPIAIKEAAVSTGYHHIIPATHDICTTGRAITVLLLYLTQGVSWLTQPWGGSTAITRKLFNDLRVSDIWSRNVVDDVSLAACLRKAGIRVINTPEACLTTPLAQETLIGWQEWFIRQILYLKFCLFGSWMALQLYWQLLTALLVWAFIKCCTIGVGGNASLSVLAAPLFLTAFAFMGAILRRLHPDPGPFWIWLAAFYLNIFLISWCLLRTLFARQLYWRGILYRVDRGGIVLDAKETESL